MFKLWRTAFLLTLCCSQYIAQNSNEAISNVEDNVGETNPKIQEAMSVMSKFYSNFIFPSNVQDFTLRASDVIKDSLLASTMFIEGNPEAATIKGTTLLIQGTFDGLQVLLSNTISHLYQDTFSKENDVFCLSFHDLSIDNQNLLLYVGEVVQSWALSAALALSIMHPTAAERSTRDSNNLGPSTEDHVGSFDLDGQQLAYPSMHKTQMMGETGRQSLDQYLDELLNDDSVPDVARTSIALRCFALESFLLFTKDCTEQIPTLDDPLWWNQQCLLKQANKETILTEESGSDITTPDLSNDHESLLSSILSRHDSIHGNLVDMKQKLMHDNPSTSRSRQQLALPWAILIGIVVGVTLSLLAFTALTLHRMMIHRRMKDIGIVDDLEALSIHRKKGSTILTAELDQHI